MSFSVTLPAVLVNNLRRRLNLMKHLALAMTLAFSAISSANLVVNGSFESPDVVATSDDGLGTYWYVRNGTSADGWTRSGSQWTWLDSRPGKWIASDGEQYTEVESGYAGSISQTIATWAGQSYRLTFDYAANPYLSSTNPDDSLRLYLNGSAFAYVDGSDSTTDDLDWTTYAYVFTASSTSTELRFQDGYTNFPYHGGFLDNVTMVAVPEPATLGVLGLGLVSLIRRRRK